MYRSIQESLKEKKDCIYKGKKNPTGYFDALDRKLELE